MPKPLTKIVDYSIRECPVCKKTHAYKLKVFPKGKVMLFGGGSHESTVLFNCQQTNEPFTYKVPDNDTYEIAGVATAEDLESDAAVPVPPGSSPDGIDEWEKNSRTVALDYCKSMLTSSVGAIPVYFAILKYLGLEKSASLSEKMFILPPVLFLVTAVVYASALKPQFGTISPAEFLAFKQKRLKLLNRHMVAGTTLFALSVAGAILVFFSAF